MTWGLPQGGPPDSTGYLEAVELEDAEVAEEDVEGADVLSEELAALLLSVLAGLGEDLCEVVSSLMPLR